MAYFVRGLKWLPEQYFHCKCQKCVINIKQMLKEHDLNIRVVIDILKNCLEYYFSFYWLTNVNELATWGYFYFFMNINFSFLKSLILFRIWDWWPCRETIKRRIRKQLTYSLFYENFKFAHSKDWNTEIDHIDFI